ncbi:MAG: hypothetical protein AABW64_04070 [Nanoarchaeota archaeon]
MEHDIATTNNYQAFHITTLCVLFIIIILATLLLIVRLYRG